MRIFPPHLAILLLAAAIGCDGGGSGEQIARPDQLRMSIVRGAQQTGPVRSAGGLNVQLVPDDVLPEPVVVRISAVSSGSVGVSATGPAFLAVPAGAIVNWRVIDDGCGSPYANVTAADGADSVVNYWRRGTRAGVECRMVAEGVASGTPFGSDTAAATFTPGEYVGGYVFERGATDPSAPFEVAATAVHDIHGNAIPFRVLVDSAYAPYVSAAGGAAGTAAGRTLHWQLDGVTAIMDGNLQFVDAAGDTITTASFRINPGASRFTYRVGS